MKSSQVEKSIAQYLKDKLSNKEIFKKIKKDPSVHEVARFLYRSQLYKTLLEYSLDKLNRGKSVPWSFVIKVLTDHRVPIPKKNIKILFQHWLSQPKNQHPSLWACSELKDKSSDFAELKKNYLKIHDQSEDTGEEEKELLKDLRFAKSQGFFQEEARIINKLISLNPHHEDYQKHQKNLKEKWAKRIFTKKRTEHSSKNIIPKLFAPEESMVKNNICKKVNQLVKKQPQQAKNLALFLYFMRWPEQSFTLLENHSKNKNDIYFLLDWLIETNQYVLSLDHIHRIIQAQGKQPEILFLMNYKKAQVLYYLGKEKEAIEHMTDIIRIRPNYRSAQSLLSQWTEEDV